MFGFFILLHLEFRGMIKIFSLKLKLLVVLDDINILILKK
jgi:hypothetical protein